MIDNLQDKEKFTGLCEHGNNPSSCPICKNTGKATREFFSTTGDVEIDPAMDPQFNFERPQTRELDPRLKSILDRIDFEVLRQIFSEIATKSGLDVRKINFINKNQITNRDDIDHAIYNAIYNNLSIRSDLYDDLERNPQATKKRGGVEGIVLQTLCHEMIHATNRQVIRGIREYGEGKSDKVKASGGYQQTRITRDREGGHDKINFYEAFNEGLTEVLTSRIALRYLSVRSLATPEDTQNAIEFLETPPDTDTTWNWFKRVDPYDLYRELAEVVIKRLSQETGLDEEMVFEAMIRSQYESQNLDEKELHDLLNEALGQDFLRRLKKAGASGIAQLVYEVNRQNLSYESNKEAASKPRFSLKERLQSWISRGSKKAA